MQKRRWLPGSHAKTEVIDPANRRLLSRARKEHKREMEKVKKSEYNTRRREQRTREKLEESHAQVQEAVEATEAQYESRLEDLRREKEVLRKEVARLNAHVRREPSKIQHAVQKALNHDNTPDAAQLNIRHVKNKIESGPTPLEPLTLDNIGGLQASSAESVGKSVPKP